MQLFVTGATGSIGQAVVPEFLGRGFAVTTLVRRQINIEGCRTIVGSLEEIGRISQEIAACDAVVHLACPRSVAPREVLQQDVVGTAELIDAWHKGPFIYASSSTVYGYPLGSLTERAPIDLENWYDRGKYINEFQLRLAERR